MVLGFFLHVWSYWDSPAALATAAPPVVSSSSRTPVPFHNIHVFITLHPQEGYELYIEGESELEHGPNYCNDQVHMPVQPPLPLTPADSKLRAQEKVLKCSDAHLAYTMNYIVFHTY
ncbi:hypothetical protein C8J56DRAFT_1048774 [Mycena floridula]|nr:hypothetical protein C8J56DRAFT_1048774 [Mycena floridula]